MSPRPPQPQQQQQQQQQYYNMTPQQNVPRPQPQRQWPTVRQPMAGGSGVVVRSTPGNVQVVGAGQNLQQKQINVPQVVQQGQLQPGQQQQRQILVRHQVPGQSAGQYKVMSPAAGQPLRQVHYRVLPGGQQVPVTPVHIRPGVAGVQGVVQRVQVRPGPAPAQPQQMIQRPVQQQQQMRVIQQTDQHHQYQQPHPQQQPQIRYVQQGGQWRQPQPQQPGQPQYRMIQRPGAPVMQQSPRPVIRTQMAPSSGGVAQQSSELQYDVEHVFIENGKTVRKMPVKIDEKTVWVECVDNVNGDVIMEAGDMNNKPTVNPAP